MIAVLLGLIAVPAWAAAPPAEKMPANAYVVAPNGNDAGTGKAAQPFSTIAKGLTALQPGDTLLIREGTYDERIQNPRITPGTASAPIIVRAYPGERPVLRGLLWLTEPSHWTISGLNVTWADGNSASEHMVKITGGTGWTYEDSELSGARSFAAFLVAGDASGWTIRGNYIHDTRASNGKNQDHLIYVNARGPGVIEGNRLIGSPNGRAVKLGPPEQGAGQVRGVKIQRNTMKDNRGPSNIQLAWDVSDTLIAGNHMESPADGRNAVTAWDLSGTGNTVTGNTIRDAKGAADAVPGIEASENRTAESPTDPTAPKPAVSDQDPLSSRNAPEPSPAATPEPSAEATPSPTPEPTPDVTPTPEPSPTPEATQPEPTSSVPESPDAMTDEQLRQHIEGLREALRLAEKALAGRSEPAPTETPKPSKVAPTTAPEPATTAPAAGIQPAPVAEPPSTNDVVRVTDAAGLTAALAAAKAGQTIGLADGVYSGKFAVKAKGTEQNPIVIKGSRKAVIDGGAPTSSKGYTVHFDGAAYVHLHGISIKGGEKGIMIDASTHLRLSDLHISGLGHEAVHLRNGTTDSVIEGNEVTDTGNTEDHYGEAFYVGTAKNNLTADTSRTDGQPDKSDRNVIRGNSVHGVAAEPVDIKEGTTGTVVEGNRFDAAGMTGEFADSCGDVKGDAVIRDNVCANPPSGQAWQLHQKLGTPVRARFERNKTPDKTGKLVPSVVQAYKGTSALVDGATKAA